MKTKQIVRAMVLSALSALLVSPALSAEENKPDDVMLLDEITVTATKTERNVRDVPASVSVITKEDIEQRHEVKTADLLRNEAGIDFLSNPSGAFPASVQLRGLPGSLAGATTLVLIDGLPVEPAAGEVWRGAIWRRLVRQIAISREAGMPLPETSATTTPSRVAVSGKRS